MNCMRVFLHDLVYKQNPKAYLKRIDQFLSIAERHHIKTIIVFFDSVWDPYPYLGQQRDPRPGVHNSGWVQGPGVHALRDSTQDARLEQYVKAVVKRFANDKRVICWDIWNEPDNMNGKIYNDYEPANKVDHVLRIIKKSFKWVRSQNPTQPLTTYVCGSGWADVEVAPIPNVAELVHFAIDNSDILSFHNYSGTEAWENMAKRFLKHGRPVLCTEFLARNGCTFQSTLPSAKKMNIGVMCWGLVAGKSNTIHGWHTWDNPDKGEPKVWQHDVFRKNGQPFSEEEAALIKKMTAEANGKLN
jgi:Cellulase (glycosyl hydrolase family 5)